VVTKVEIAEQVRLAPISVKKQIPRVFEARDDRSSPVRPRRHRATDTVPLRFSELVLEAVDVPSTIDRTLGIYSGVNAPHKPCEDRTSGFLLQRAAFELASTSRCTQLESGSRNGIVPFIS